jgi:hypothetical protein
VVPQVEARFEHPSLKEIEIPKETSNVISDINGNNGKHDLVLEKVLFWNNL